MSDNSKKGTDSDAEVLASVTKRLLSDQHGKLTEEFRGQVKQQEANDSFNDDDCGVDDDPNAVDSPPVQEQDSLVRASKRLAGRNMEAREAGYRAYWEDCPDDD